MHIGQAVRLNRVFNLLLRSHSHIGTHQNDVLGSDVHKECGRVIGHIIHHDAYAPRIPAILL